MLPARKLVHLASRVRRALTRNVQKFQTRHRRQLDFQQALAEGKALVDYPDFFGSGMKDVSSEEISQMNLTLDSLDINNPLVQYTKGVMSGQLDSAPARGLLVLLMSQAAAQLNTDTHTLEVTGKQRSVAKITELLHMGCFLHQGLKPDEPEDPDTSSKPSEMDEDMKSRLKLTVLSGDFFQIVASMAMAELDNPSAIVVIMESLQEMCRTEFELEPWGKRGEVSLNTDWTEEKWRHWHSGSDGVIVAGTTMAALMLADHAPHVVQIGGKVAEGTVLSWKAHADIQLFRSAGDGSDEFPLISLPVLLQMKTDPRSVLDIVLSENGVDYKKLQEVVVSGDAMEEAQFFMEDLIFTTLQDISSFPSSDYRTALENLVHSLRWTTPEPT